MTVPSTARRAGPYTGNGSTTTFSFSFKTFAAGDLLVTRTASSGVETTLVLNSDYSVSLNVDQDASPGGTITYPISGSPLPAGQKLTIVGDLEYEQTTDLLGGGAFNARVIEDTFDRATIQIQQLEERLDRAAVLPVSVSGVSATLPDPEASKVLGWNVTETGLVNIDASSLASVTASAYVVVDKFTGDGSTTQFVCSQLPGSTNAAEVTVAGLMQNPAVDYTVSGARVVFAAPPANGAVIIVRFLVAASQSSGAAFTTERHIATSGQSVFTLANAYAPGADTISVFINGVLMTSVIDYAETSANVVTFVTGLSLNDEVVFHIWRTTVLSTADSANVSYTPAGSGAVQRTVQSKLRDVVSVKDFGAVGDGVTDDTVAIQAAIDSLSTYQGVSFSPGSYKTNGVINITTSDVGIDFGTATFFVGDTGANGTTTTGATGKIGFLFKQADNISVIGSPKFIGQGTAGVTSLTGLVFDDCDNAHVPAEMYFENMAAGRFVSLCTNSSFGKVTGKTLNGLQTFESPPTTAQGSLEVVIGCVNCIFDDLFCEGNILPARYFSIGAASPDNEFCKTGTTTSIATGNTATALAIRSAVNCCFGDVSGSGLTAAILLIIYSGNTSWSVDRNNFGSVSATLLNTAASEDAVVYSSSTEPTKTIGVNYFGNVSCVGTGEYGIFVASGTLSFNNVSLYGFGRPVFVHSSTIYINSLVASGQNLEAITYGQGANVTINSVDILSGATSSTTACIRYNSAIGTGGLGRINFGAITYRYNSIGNDYLYVVMDLSNGFETTRINSINGGGSSGKQARFASDEFFVKNGVWSGPAIPTTGTYSVGTVLMKSNAVAGGTPGWVCTTAGTPGTWKAMANLAP